MGQERNAYNNFVGKLQGKNYIEDLGLNGRILK
jgi:hypothetical protein